MTRKTLLVMIALVVALGAASLATASRHRHGLKLAHVSVQASAAPNDVGGDIAFCPKGFFATGGGAEFVSGAPLLGSIGLGDRSYSAIFIDASGSGSSMNVQASCIKSKTQEANGRVVSRKAERRAFNEQLQAMRRAR
jgi:hypothetical protein